MTSLAERLHASSIPERIVAAWNAAATRWNPIATIVVAWAVLTGPLVFFRGYNSDEGLAVSIARTALEDGEWLVPHMFNLRWVERPTLLSWIIAAISAPIGGVNQFTARLPIVLFLLAGCLLIYALLRKLNASVAAALLGVALFLACPLVIRSNVMITADLPLAVLLFFAFFLWWTGYQQRALGFGRWLAIGVVLAFAGLLKGPQPLAYFALGIGCYVLLSRSWRQIPGLAMAGVICALPLAFWYAAIYAPGDEFDLGSVHAGASCRAVARASQYGLRHRDGDVAGSPDGRGLPHSRSVRRTRGAGRLRGGGIVLRVHRRRHHPVLAGRLGAALLPADDHDAVRVRRPRLRSSERAAAGHRRAGPAGDGRTARLRPGAVAALAVHAVALPAIEARRGAGHGAGASRAGADLPDGRHRAQCPAYVPGRILNAKPAELPAIPGPAWFILPIDQADTLLAREPDKLHVVIPLGDAEQWRLLRLDR